MNSGSTCVEHLWKNQKIKTGLEKLGGGHKNVEEEAKL